MESGRNCLSCSALCANQDSVELIRHSQIYVYRQVRSRYRESRRYRIERAGRERRDSDHRIRGIDDGKGLHSSSGIDRICRYRSKSARYHKGRQRRIRELTRVVGQRQGWGTSSTGCRSRRWSWSWSRRRATLRPNHPPVKPCFLMPPNWAVFGLSA